MVSNIFYVHPENWGRFPIWLIFFRWVGSTTNQKTIDRCWGCWRSPKMMHRCTSIEAFLGGIRQAAVNRMMSSHVLRRESLKQIVYLPFPVCEAVKIIWVLVACGHLICSFFWSVAMGQYSVIWLAFLSHGILFCWSKTWISIDMNGNLGGLVEAPLHLVFLTLAPINPFVA